MATRQGQAKVQRSSHRSKSTFATTASCQKVVKEGHGFIEIQSDLSHPDLKPILLGHRIDGVPTGPAALWADVALTLANHLADRAQQEKPRLGFNVSGMIMKSPLALTTGKQIYRASGHLDLVSRSVWVEIFSINDFGKVLAHHAECIVKLEDCNAWEQAWERGEHLVKERVDALHGSSSLSGDVSLVTREVAYKLVQNSVDYSTPYQGMEAVAYDETDDEASACLRFQGRSDANFFLSPYTIDVLCQVAGFVVHANPELDLKSYNLVNHGWDSLRISKPLQDGIAYHSHVNMQDTERGFSTGDVYVLEDTQIVAAVRGIRFQHIPRQTGVSHSPSNVPTLETEVASDLSSQTVATAPSSLPIDEEVSKAMSALSIIAKEIGIRIGEMSPDDAFNDLGLDSLLSLTITNCLRDELGIEVNSSIFATCPTVRQLVEFINDDADTTAAQSTPAAMSSTPVSSSSGSSTISSSNSSESDGGSIPSTSPSSIASSDIGDDIKEENNKPKIPPLAAQIRALIAEEAGVEAHEIDGSTTLAELGLDSLLAITLASRLREYLNKKGITPAMFADEASTCDDVVSALGLRP